VPEDPGETLARGKALGALCAPVPHMAGTMKGVRGYMVGRGLPAKPVQTGEGAGNHKARGSLALRERRELRVRT